MRSILLATMIMISVISFSQTTKPLQIVLTGMPDSTRCEFNGSEYYSKGASIWVTKAIGNKELYIYSELGLLMYELTITDKTSLIVITFD